MFAREKGFIYHTRINDIQERVLRLEQIVESLLNCKLSDVVNCITIGKEIISVFIFFLGCKSIVLTYKTFTKLFLFLKVF